MTEKNLEKSIAKIDVYDLVQIAVLAAFTYISTALINFPYGKGVVHLGDSVVFLAAVLVGRRKGAMAAAIGMCMFDLLSPYFIWAPFTFVIKGMMAYVAGSIAYRKNYEGNNILNNVFAFTIAGLWMIVGYLIAGTILNYFTVSPDLAKSFLVATADIPGNIAQVIVGIAIATPLSKGLKGINKIIR